MIYKPEKLSSFYNTKINRKDSSKKYTKSLIFEM